MTIIKVIYIYYKMTDGPYNVKLIIKVLPALQAIIL